MNGFGQNLRATLERVRLPAATEAALQEAIASSFRAAGIAFEREVSLSSKDRIDFLVEGRVGLEVKIVGGLSEVTRQLHRYAQSERIEALILVTTRMRHRALERELNGKTVDVVHLIGGSL